MRGNIWVPNFVIFSDWWTYVKCPLFESPYDFCTSLVFYLFYCCDHIINGRRRHLKFLCEELNNYGINWILWLSLPFVTKTDVLLIASSYLLLVFFYHAADNILVACSEKYFGLWCCWSIERIEVLNRCWGGVKDHPFSRILVITVS